MARDSIFLGMVYMLGLGILLGWIPIFGPLFAGAVGGAKAGSPARGMVAAILPGILAGVATAFILAWIPGIPDWVAAVFGTVLGIVVLASLVLMMAGALLGGAVARHRRPTGMATL